MKNYIADTLKSNGNIGAKNGIKAKDLLACLGRSTSKDSIRYLQAEIRKFRINWREEDGIENFISSDTENGYYLISDIKEAEHFVKSQENRAIKAFETSKHIRLYLKNNKELNKGADL
ncbi:MAG: hypothetical protein ACI4VF_09935 [Lachnospirales bacterium]